MDNIKYYSTEASSLLEIRGEDAQKFLQSLITADVAAISENHFYPAALLNAQGKIIFDFLLTTNNSSFYLTINKQYKESFLQRLAMYKLRSNVEIIEHDSEHIILTNEQNYGFYDSRFSPLNVRHIYKILHQEYSELNQNKTLAEDFNELRINYRIAVMGADFLPNSIYPHNINYDLLQGVSFTKGCYIGQEVVARMQHKTSVKKRLFIVTAKQALNTGEAILADEKIIGTIATAKGAKALAILRLDHLEQAKIIRVGEKIVTIN